MSLFDICHASYPQNLLRLACLDSEKDLLNLSMTKIRACYDLTGVWKQDKELLYSLYQIAKFCDNMGGHDWWPEEDDPAYIEGEIHPEIIYQPLVDYFYNFIKSNSYADKFLTIAFFLESPLWGWTDEDGWHYLHSNNLKFIQNCPNLTIRKNYPHANTLVVSSKSDSIYLDAQNGAYVPSRENPIHNFLMESRYNKSAYYCLDVKYGNSPCFMHRVIEPYRGQESGWSWETLTFNLKDFKSFTEDFYNKALCHTTETI